MRDNIIYKHKHKFEKKLESFKASDKLIEEQRKEVLGFIDSCFNEEHERQIGYARMTKYMTYLHKFGLHINKSFSNSTVDDVRRALKQIEGDDITDSTKDDQRKIIKKFYKWLLGKNQDYPECVKWMKGIGKNGKLLPEELLTEDEIKLLIQNAPTIRDRAFIATIAESGMRVGEMLHMLRKHVSFDEYGGILIVPVEGKTGMRRVRIVNSVPYLSTWLENHPLKEHDAYLWVRSGATVNKPISYVLMREMLKRTAKIAGIKKRVYWHLHRHSAASKEAVFLSQALLNERYGWTQGSKMSSVYLHMGGKDLDNALLQHYGKKSDEEIRKEKPKDTLSPWICGICQNNNANINKCCGKCGRPKGIQEALELEKKEVFADKVTAKMEIGQNREWLKNIIREILVEEGAIEAHQ